MTQHIIQRPVKEEYNDFKFDDSVWVTQGEGDDWEDEEVQHHSHFTRSRAGSPTGNSITGTRTIRKRRRPLLTAKGSRKQVSFRSTEPFKTETPPLIAREDVINGLISGSIFTGNYALDVFKRALYYLRFPLSIFVVLYILSHIALKMEHTFKSVFSPFCILPGISRSRLCYIPLPLEPPRPRPQWADLVEVESKSFRQLMGDVVGGSALSLEVKHAEMATTDLVALVRISNLKAKDTLATSLVEFIDTAKRTGRGLQRLSSKVGGTVDSIMAANEHALNTIESARVNEPSPWSLRAISPWKRKSTSLVVAETFEDAMNTLSRHLERLILEAEVSDKNLNDLEEHLNSIHEIVAREDSSVLSEKQDLLADLWTILGGNRNKLRNFNSHLALLKDLATYRKQASVHVAVALQTLRGMAHDMEDMRERVAAPDLLGSSVPVEQHIRTIEMGLQRLKEGRVRAKELEQDAIRRILSIKENEDN